MNFLRWFGLVFWTVNIAGAIGCLFTDDFLGRSYQAWMISALVGWCCWLQSQIRRVVFVRIVEVDRDVDR